MTHRQDMNSAAQKQTKTEAKAKVAIKSIRCANSLASHLLSSPSRLDFASLLLLRCMMNLSAALQQCGHNSSIHTTITSPLVASLYRTTNPTRIEIQIAALAHYSFIMPDSDTDISFSSSDDDSKHAAASKPSVSLKPSHVTLRPTVDQIRASLALPSSLSTAAVPRKPSAIRSADTLSSPSIEDEIDFDDEDLLTDPSESKSALSQPGQLSSRALSDRPIVPLKPSGSLDRLHPPSSIESSALLASNKPQSMSSSTSSILKRLTQPVSKPVATVSSVPISERLASLAKSSSNSSLRIEQKLATQVDIAKSSSQDSLLTDSVTDASIVSIHRPTSSTVETSAVAKRANERAAAAAQVNSESDESIDISVDEDADDKPAIKPVAVIDAKPQVKVNDASALDALIDEDESSLDRKALQRSQPPTITALSSFKPPETRKSTVSVMSDDYGSDTFDDDASERKYSISVPRGATGSAVPSKQSNVLQDRSNQQQSTPLPSVAETKPASTAVQSALPPPHPASVSPMPALPPSADAPSRIVYDPRYFEPLKIDSSTIQSDDPPHLTAFFARYGHFSRQAAPVPSHAAANAAFTSYAQSEDESLRRLLNYSMNRIDNTEDDDRRQNEESNQLRRKLQEKVTQAQYAASHSLDAEHAQGRAIDQKGVHDSALLNMLLRQMLSSTALQPSVDVNQSSHDHAEQLSLFVDPSNVSAPPVPSLADASTAPLPARSSLALIEESYDYAKSFTLHNYKLAVLSRAVQLSAETPQQQVHRSVIEGVLRETMNQVLADEAIIELVKKVTLQRIKHRMQY